MNIPKSTIVDPLDQTQDQGTKQTSVPLGVLKEMNAGILVSKGSLWHYCQEPWIDGYEIQTIGATEARILWGQRSLVVVNAKEIRDNLFGHNAFREAKIYDLLELFAFICPTISCAPSLLGLSEALLLGPVDRGGAISRVMDIVTILGQRCKDSDLGFRLLAQAGIEALAKLDWPWAPYLSARLKETQIPDDFQRPDPLRVWTLLEEWEEGPPRPAPSHIVLDFAEIEQALKTKLNDIGLDEDRPEQSQFAQGVRSLFDPKWMPDQPQFLLAEAGTGIGKTLGYLIPSLLWAEKSGGQVWISTYTRALQKQIWQDTKRLIPDPKAHEDQIAVRKGRENYLCLLNYQDRIGALTMAQFGLEAILLARWIVYTLDGDLLSGDRPSWIEKLKPNPLGTHSPLSVMALIDRRGECTYGACPHYRVCFIEKSQRRAKTARLVIANHALVLSQAAFDHYDKALELPITPHSDEHLSVSEPALSRLIFDEGHHLFAAADSAFRTQISLQEAHELRRYIRGPESAHKRGRGLESRLKDLLDDQDTEAKTALKSLIRAASILPSDGFSGRLKLMIDKGDETDLSQEQSQAQGPIEALMHEVITQLMLRQDGYGAKLPYSRLSDSGFESDLYPVMSALKEAASEAAKAVRHLELSFTALVKALEQKLKTMAQTSEALEIAHKSILFSRLEGIGRGLQRRARHTLPSWRGLLDDISLDQDDEASREKKSLFVDFLSLQTFQNRIFDVAINRHYRDPSLPLAEVVIKPAQSVLVASATLADPSIDTDNDQAKDPFSLAISQTGASHLLMGARTLRIQSPFQYAHQARAFVVTDVPKDDTLSVALAIQSLFMASKGGGLGLFTAISRLRAVHKLLKPALNEQGINLLAQHVDQWEVPDLISLFKSDPDSCLLGTDAVRDGIDVPGRALRLLVFDRLPWARPDILHRERRTILGGKDYDDALIKARLAQAFGRLIRRKDDKGCFVLLDRGSPSRLMKALPEGVLIQRLSLAEVVSGIEAFLA